MPAMSSFNKGPNGPMRLYVGSLHFNITEEMLRSIFEPFGKIEHMQLMIDVETGRSKGYGFITVRVVGLWIIYGESIKLDLFDY